MPRPIVYITAYNCIIMYVYAVNKFNHSIKYYATPYAH